MIRPDATPEAEPVPSERRAAILITILTTVLLLTVLAVVYPACLNGHGRFVWPPRF